MRHPLTRYRYIVFDWNGTAIDDVELALSCVNRMRCDLGLQPVDIEAYLGKFRFPIYDFYGDLGFDFEQSPFEMLIDRYLSDFNERIAECALCSGFLNFATQARTDGVILSVLSASHQDILIETAKRHGIDKLLEHLVGLDDTAASGKLTRARELDERLERNLNEPVLMIGDTDHDFDVSQACGWDFLAVASGHQSRSRLERLGVPVIDSLDEVALFAIEKEDFVT